MFSSIMLLQLLCCLLFIQSVYSNAASETDISSSFPENWCDTRYGTATRTTGECICKSLCDGPACVNQHGLSFYAYKNCPTCTCEKPKPDTILVKQAPNECLLADEEEEMMAIRSVRQKSGRAEYEGDTEADSTWADWIEDNGRTVFAICMSCALLSFFIMLLFIKL